MSVATPALPVRAEHLWAALLPATLMNLPLGLVCSCVLRLRGWVLGALSGGAMLNALVAGAVSAAPACPGEQVATEPSTKLRSRKIAGSMNGFRAVKVCTRNT
jgi:hypothetical protein